MPLTRHRATRRVSRATATRLFALLEEQLKLNPSLVRLFKMFFVFVLLWHWVGCLWLFVFQMEYVDVELAELIGRAAIARARVESVPNDCDDAGRCNEWVPPLYILGMPLGSANLPTSRTARAHCAAHAFWDPRRKQSRTTSISGCTRSTGRWR